MTAYWPVVQARLVDLLPTLLPAGVVVFDGPSAGREKGAKQYVTVGATAEGAGGSYTQPDSATSGDFRAEQGQVECEFTDWSGDSNAPTKRGVVFGWADLLEASVRADQTLGVLPKGSVTELAGELVMGATTVRLVVTLSYLVPLAP